MLKQSFQTWHASQIQQQIQKDSNSSLGPVNLHLSTVKPLHAQSIIEAFEYIKSHPEIIINGAAGIPDKLI